MNHKTVRQPFTAFGAGEPNVFYGGDDMPDGYWRVVNSDGNALTNKHVAPRCAQRHAGLPCRGWIQQVRHG